MTRLVKVLIHDPSKYLWILFLNYYVWRIILLKLQVEWVYSIVDCCDLWRQIISSNWNENEMLLSWCNFYHKFIFVDIIINIGTDQDQQDAFKLFPGYLIPKGWRLLVVHTTFHLNPRNYRFPYKFDPSRFEVNNLNLSKWRPSILSMHIKNIIAHV